MTADPWDPSSPYLRVLVDRLRGGHYAASIEERDLDGRGVQSVLVDDQVVVWVGEPHGKPSRRGHDRIGSPARLVDVCLLSQSGFVSDFWAPQPPIWWQAIGYSRTARGVVVAGAYDMSGVAAFIESKRRIEIPAKDGGSVTVTPGQAIARALRKSKWQGVRGRVRQAATVIGVDADVDALTASAAADYFVTQATTDGGVALRGSWVVIYDPRTNVWERVVGEAAGAEDLAPPVRRREGLNAHVLKILETDAFGIGVHSPRSKRRILSTSGKEAREAEATVTAATHLSAASHEREREAAVESFERRLDQDELALWRQMQADPEVTQQELATRLRWGIKRVREVRRRLQAIGGSSRH